MSEYLEKIAEDAFNDELSKIAAASKDLKSRVKSNQNKWDRFDEGRINKYNDAENCKRVYQALTENNQ